MQCHGVTFDLCSCQKCFTAASKAYLSYHKVILIVTSDYYIYFFLIVLSLLKTTLQLISRLIYLFNMLFYTNYTKNSYLAGKISGNFFSLFQNSIGFKFGTFERHFHDKA